MRGPECVNEADFAEQRRRRRARVSGRAAGQGLGRTGRRPASPPAPSGGRLREWPVRAHTHHTTAHASAHANAHANAHVNAHVNAHTNAHANAHVNAHAQQASEVVDVPARGARDGPAWSNSPSINRPGVGQHSSRANPAGSRAPTKRTHLGRHLQRGVEGQLVGLPLGVAEDDGAAVGAAVPAPTQKKTPPKQQLARRGRGMESTRATVPSTLAHSEEAPTVPSTLSHTQKQRGNCAQRKQHQGNPVWVGGAGERGLRDGTHTFTTSPIVALRLWKGTMSM
jgi:hypothetical protein